MGDDNHWMHKGFLMLQMIIVMQLSTWVILQFMLELIDLTDLMADFVGLMVINEIDNWTGLIFEAHLENSYEDIVTGDRYMIS